MNASIHSAYDSPVIAPPAPISYDDPLDEDASSDPIIPTTRRGLTRLALIAAETGARFQRDGEGMDPMGWLLAPRRLFGGGVAIDAVLGFADEDDRDRFFLWLVERVDRWDAWTGIAHKRGGVALTQHLFAMLVAEGGLS